MRAVIQRVKRASVTIDEKIQSSIGKGLLVLVGIGDADKQEDIDWLSAKISNLRIFDDVQGVMNFSVKEVRGDILIVSQFTLYASSKKGNRPSYIRSAKSEVAIPLYEKFIRQMEFDLERQVHTGEFGAHMQVELLNDGPVTILIDTRNRE